MSTVAERAERGAALLDARRPGWWREIDLGRLDIIDGCNCVAGQLGNGRFLATYDALGMDSPADEIAHGFNSADHDYLGAPGDVIEAVEAECVALTEAWRTLILARRAAAEVPA
jgi:hypothetical protein